MNVWGQIRSRSRLHETRTVRDSSSYTLKLKSANFSSQKSGFLLWKWQILFIDSLFKNISYTFYSYRIHPADLLHVNQAQNLTRASVLSVIFVVGDPDQPRQRSQHLYYSERVSGLSFVSWHHHSGVGITDGIKNGQRILKVRSLKSRHVGSTILPFTVLVSSFFRPMWRVRTRRSRRPPFRPSAGAPPTSLRWRTLVWTVWCCCFPTETVQCVHSLHGVVESSPPSVY